MFRYLLLVFLIIPTWTLAQNLELGIPYGHTASVTALCFSHDGQYLFTGSEDGTIRKWDYQTGRLLFTSKSKSMVMVSISPYEDQRYMYISTGGTDGYPWILDMEENEFYRKTGNPLIANLGDPESVPTPTSVLNVKYNDDGIIQFVNPADQRLIYQIKEPEFDPNLPENHYFQYGLGAHHAYLNDGNLLLRTPKGELVLINPETSKQLISYSLPGEKDIIFNQFEIPPAFSVHPNGNILVRGLSDGRVIVQELKTGKTLQILQSHVTAHSRVAFSEEGNQLELIGLDGYFRTWDFEANRIVKNQKAIPQKSYDPKPIRVDENRWIINVLGEGLFLFDESTGKQVSLYDFKSNPNISDYQYSPLNQTFVFSHFEDFDYSWIEVDLKTLKAKKITGTSPKLGIAIHPDKKQAFFLRSPDQDELSSNFEPYMVDIRTGKESWKGEPFEWTPDSRFNIPKAQFSPSGDFIAIIESLSDDYDGTDITLYNLKSSKKQFKIHQPDGSYVDEVTFSPNEQFVLTPNSNGVVNAYDMNTGKLIRSFAGHKAPVLSATFSPDESRIVTSGRNSKVIIWDFQSGALLSTLLAIDQEDWVVLDSSGLFDASPRSMELMYYIVTENKKQEVIELESLKPRYYEPGLLQKQLGLSSERLRDVNNLTDIELYPEISTNIENDQLQINLKKRNGGIGPLSVRINGKEVISEENKTSKTDFTYDLRDYQGFLYRHPDSLNVVGVQVYNQGAWLKSPIKNLNYEVSVWTRGQGNSDNSAWSSEIRPKMYAICIGTSDYTGNSMDLKYADADAQAMANALASVGAQLFTNGDSLEVHCLSTSEPATGSLSEQVQYQFPSKANITKLLSEVQHQAKAEDVVLVYLSGHGVTYGSAEKTQFYYLTHGVSSEDLSDAAIRNKYAISSGELTSLLNKIPALKQVLVIDACNSGKAVDDITTGTRSLNSSQIRALDRMKDRTGMFILSGSASNKVSYEASEYGQGLLTYSLLQGMLGIATRKTADGDYVDVMKLFQFARDEVPKLASSVRGIQTPVLGFPKQASSFDIGIVNEQVNINVASKKPVFIRSNFLNLNTLIDDLKLVQFLEKEFRIESEKGKDADLIYVDVNEYPGAYKISGTYEKGEEEISIKLKLFKDGKLVADLNPRPTTDPEKLASLILREVKKKLSED